MTINKIDTNQRRASYDLDFPMFSNPASAQNVSCLRLCGKDVRLKGYA